MTAPPTRPIKVAIVGGGCAAMAAAHELTRPEQGGRFEVTVYQQGWRLGGKGASGRGPCGRIEEHGLHVWMGCYENAFRLMRSVYGELGRDPRTHPIPDWRHAFMPASHIGLASWDADTDWTVWSTTFPPLPGEPGAPLAGGADNPFSSWGYVVRMVEVMRALFDTVTSGHAWAAAVAPLLPASLSELVARADALARTALGSLDTVIGLVGNQLLTLVALVRAALPHEVAAAATGLAEAVLRALDLIRPAAANDPNRQRAGEVLEIIAGALVGILRSGVLVHPRGFDVLDDLDFVDWLRQNGVSAHAANSPFVRGLYSLMFAYEGGDYTRPRQAAGQALRGCLRMFFTYRGSFFWKMQAGMGDIVFAPLYEVLRRRGVRFELFHRLANVRLGGEPGAPRHVAGLDFLVQAEVRGGRPYEPLIDVHGLACWPSEPDWSQLVDGERMRERGVAFESHWDTWHVRRHSLRVGEDFDFVVLGVSVGAIPHVCAELLEHDGRWRTMCDQLATVATQSLQLWTHASMPALGWSRGPVTMTAFASPFDTWSDMTHLIPAEHWPPHLPVGAIAYFCNVLDERDARRCGPEDDGYQRRVQALVRESARTFVERDLPRLWPAWGGAAGWDGLVDWTRAQEQGRSIDDPVHPLDTQFYVGNVNPSDRYVQCLPGTTKHRISPLDRTYDNLTIAGDWTDCGLNLGCVESAIMSGLLASHALSGLPRLDEIVGYDHP